MAEMGPMPFEFEFEIEPMVMQGPANQFADVQFVSMADQMRHEQQELINRLYPELAQAESESFLPVEAAEDKDFAPEQPEDEDDDDEDDEDDKAPKGEEENDEDEEEADEEAQPARSHWKGKRGGHRGRHGGEGRKHH